MSNERDPEVERERALEQLFARAEPRLQPPPADAEEVRRAVKAEWDALAVRRRQRSSHLSPRPRPLLRGLPYISAAALPRPESCRRSSRASSVCRAR
jgi:hypothetical protein